MNPLLHPEVQAFIRQADGKDVAALALAKNPFPEIPFRSILAQISARHKAKDKLPKWFETDGVLFPEPISIEQASSEQTAKYKASIVSGKLMDLTGGFGVDDYYFAQNCAHIWHCEQNDDLSQTVEHNLNVFGVENVSCISGDSASTLEKIDESLDWIYADPSRRHDLKGKVFRLADCTPDAAADLKKWLKKAPNVLIKTAPLLDLSAGLSELSNVKTIHIVALKGEVRELLWHIERDFTGIPEIIAIDLTSGQKFQIPFGKTCEAEYSEPLAYLFEPNPALMKTGAFDCIGVVYGLKKLHRHSHLYTSDDMAAFPGRIFKIDRKIPYSKQSMKELSGAKANVKTRNFPESVENLRKKWKMADGGENYLFFTTDIHDDKIVLLCKKN